MIRFQTRFDESAPPIAALTCASVVLAILLMAGQVGYAAEPDLSDRYLLVNLRASAIHDETFHKLATIAKSRSSSAPRLGVSGIISYFRHPPEQNLEQLRRLLQLAEQYELAVLVQLDGEQWWQNRPDLWNWWDPSRPGFDPANAANVEWSGWSSEDALKIAWRNWGRQLRVLPPPNLMSAKYRAAAHAAMRPLVDEIIRWQAALPADKSQLLVGVKLGWESAIGMGSYYYENGNALVGADPADDPSRPIKAEILPGRGFAPIGYAAVSTAGLARDGELLEKNLAEVVRRHLDDLAAEARSAGLPRSQIFVHCGGWAEGELLYRSALNEHSCPGWSFYKHARNPLQDKTAMRALTDSDAPYWAATEWLPVGAKSADDWHAAIANTLSIDRCRYVCIFNWHGISKNDDAVTAIRRTMAGK